MARPLPRLTSAFILATLLLFQGAGCGRDRASGPLPQEVYVWQRAWTPAVHDAVAAHAGDFDAVAVLGAEVGWERGRREVARAEVDWSALTTHARAVAVAIRVGPFDRAAEPHGVAGDALAALAAELVAEARADGVSPRELQLDYDSPTSGLGDYARWVDTVRAAVPDVRIVITSLPTWLDAPAFEALAERVDAYVLQVHSVTRPERVDAIPPLCDPAAARRWIDRAAEMGRPFRVALPTYGYRLGFDADGLFLGLTAEAPARPWPADAQVRDLRADPAAMAGLVRALTADRPAELTAVAWYRLPVAGDALVWSDATFSAVRRGEDVAPDLRLSLVWTEPTLAEVHADNLGSADAFAPAAVRVKLPAPPLAADAQGGFTLADSLTATVFERGPDVRPVAPGGSLTVGWIRLATPPKNREDIVVSPSP